MTVADARRRARRRRAAGDDVVDEIAARRAADLARRAGGATHARPDARRAPVGHRRRATSSAASRGRAPPHRGGQAALAVGRGDRRRGRRRRRARPRLRGAAARRRSPSCASRTGSAARSTTSRPSARPCRSRCSPRSSSSTRASCRCSARPAPTSSSCSRCSIPRRRLAALVDARARSRPRAAGRGARRARARPGARRPRARVIGINNRDLRTLDVDPERAVRLRRPRSRTTGWSIAESGRARAVDRRRLAGASGSTRALVGEALMRAADPAAAARAFVAAGACPDRPRPNADRLPFVKICGITDAGRRRGGDPRRRRRDRAEPRARDAARAVTRRSGRRSPGSPGRRGAGAGPGGSSRHRRRPGRATGRDRGGRGPGRRPAQRRRAAGARGCGLARPAVEGAPPPGRRAADRGGGASRGDAIAIAAGRATTSRPAPSGHARHGRRASSRRHRHARRQRARRGSSPARCPSSLAGGLDPANVAPGAARDPGRRRRRRLAASRPPRVPGERPRKDPFRVALFAKRARAARLDRPHVARPPDPGRRRPARGRRAGRWGTRTGVRRPLRPRDADGRAPGLERAYAEIRAGSTLLGGAPRAARDLRRPSDPALPRRPPRRRGLASPGRARPAPPVVPGRLPTRLRALPQARGPRPHRRAQDQQRARPGAPDAAGSGKTRVIAETGAGQHGVATATACALLDLPCVVYMGEEDIRRQAPNVLRMRALGAEVRPVTSRHRDAQGRGQRGDARLGDERRDDPLRARVGDGPAPVPDDRARPPARPRRRGRGPAGGRRGPAARPRPRLRRRWLERHRPARIASSASRRSAWRSRRPPARASRPDATPPPWPAGRRGSCTAARSLMLQDRDGQVVEAHSISAGLDYPGVGPQIAALVTAGRARARRGHRRRGGRRGSVGRPGRRDPAGPRDGPRLRGPAAAAGGHRGLR